MGWLSGFRRKRLTVAVPLHRAGPWVDVVSRNISLIPPGACIVLSDRTLQDDALERLRKRHREDRRIDFRSGDDVPGWREHVNTLIEANRSPLFAILPQDDSITSRFYERLVRALKGRKSAALAFGSLQVVDHPDGFEGALPSPELELGVLEPWREALALDQAWNLGIAWRGVVRRRCLLPVAPTPGDRFADQIWVFGIALTGHLVEVPEAVYVKRYHSGNTHGEWSHLTERERYEVKAAEIRRRLGRRPNEVSAALAILAEQRQCEPRGEP